MDWRGQEEVANKGSRERTRKKKRLMRILGGEGITREWLCHVKTPSFDPSPPLSVDHTIVNHKGIDYKGLIFSTSEREHDSRSGEGGRGWRGVRDMGG